MRGIQLAAWIALLGVQALALLIGISVYFAEDSFESDAKLLIATFAGGMGVFGLVITTSWLRQGDRRAWFALWYLPIFFVLHLIVLGTYVPDLIFAFITGAALLLLRPLRARDASEVPVR